MNTLDDNQTYYDPSSVSSREIGSRYGIFWALAAIIFGLLSYLLGFTDPSSPNIAGSLISSLIAIAIGVIMLVLPIQKAKTGLGGYITFGKAFTTGFWAVLIYSLIASVWTFVFLNFIAPEMMDAMMNAEQIEQLEEQGMSTFAELMTNPMFIAVLGLITTLVGWVIINLIISAILKKDPPLA